MGKPWLYLTIDEDRGLMLVRGGEARRITHLLAPENTPPVWSSSGRGWVVPAAMQADLEAYAEFHRLGFMAVSRRGEATA